MKIISNNLLSFSRKFPPTKITRYTASGTEVAVPYNAFLLSVRDNRISATAVLVDVPIGQTTGKARLDVGALPAVVGAAGGVVGEHDNVLGYRNEKIFN